MALTFVTGTTPTPPLGLPGTVGNPNAVPGSNGEVVPPGPGLSPDPRRVGRVVSGFAALDANDKFTPEQRAASKAVLLGKLTPEEQAAVSAVLDSKAAVAAEEPLGETMRKVFYMVSIEHADGPTPEEKGRMQGEILASMPPEKQRAVMGLFMQAHNNAAELERLRAVAPKTAAAMGPESNAHLDEIIDKLRALDPKPAAMGPEFHARLGEIIDKLHAWDPRPATKAASFQPFSDMNHQLPLPESLLFLHLLRLLLLLVSAFLTPFGVAAIHMLSFPQSLWSTAFDAQAKIFPVLAMTYFSTVVSAMAPFAIRGINTIDGGSGRWEEGPEAPAMVVGLTSFLILPLIAVFGPGDSAYQGPYASRESFCWMFIALWLVHGAINFYHIVCERRLETASKANAQA